MQNDREARQTAGDFFQNVETKGRRNEDALFVARALRRRELVRAVRGADCNREGIAPGAFYEFLYIFRTGIGRILVAYLDFVFDAGQRAQLCLNDNAALMGILYDLTGDKAYYDRALGIADTYVRLQREDGSLPIKVDFVTGEPVNDACAMLHPLLRYFQRLKADYGVETYAEAQAEGERWMRDVAIRNFDMTGQFEDVTVLGLQPYENLTNCTAAPYAAYLLSKGAPSAEDLTDAVDLARFSEDQFTFWDTPLTENGIKDKATPCVYEQYKYQKPVDNSACNVADAMLSLYEATGEEIYLAKGKALIDNITVVQNAVNGQIPTTWDFRPTKSDRNRTYWINCSYSSISSLLRLEKLLAERQK